MPDHTSSTPEHYLKWWSYVLNPLIPITLDPEDIEILVAGGSGRHSQYFAPGQGKVAVSKRVDPWK